MVNSSKSSKQAQEDNELISLYLTDENREALSILLSKYKPLVISRVDYFGFNKNEVDDIVQECMLALFTSLVSYNSEKASFSTFARVCIDRMLISILRSKNALKSIPEGAFVSFDDAVLGFANSSTSPETYFERIDSFHNLKARVKEALSGFEYTVLLHIFNGLTYSEISELLNVNVKSVDNAVQRLRKKVKKI